MVLRYPFWATNDITVPGTSDPNKEEPSQIQFDEGWTTQIPELQHMNWVQNNFSEWIRRMNEWVYLADGGTAQVGRLHGVVGNTTVKLPVDAEVGQSLRIGPSIGTNLEATPVIVEAQGGQVVMDSSYTSIKLDIPIACYMFDFNGTRWDLSIVGFQPNTRVGSTL